MLLGGGGSIFIGFGELIEKNAMSFNKDGKLVRNEDGEVSERKIMVGKYQLHIECNSRFVCGDRVVLAKYDLYSPTSQEAKNVDFDWDEFDWDVKGGNHFDELAANYFKPDLSEKFIVEKILVNKFGDLKISFTNGFALDVIIDTSLNDECWRFFEYGNIETHLIITGQGIDNDTE